MSDDILSRYPSVRGNARAMAMLSTLLRDRGLYQDALALGLAAIEQAPGDMEVRDVVRDSLSRGVPRFHPGMLRDSQRNQAYAHTIQRLVRPGMLVLEIGTGAGLLALLAARAGARVVTCESNPMVAAAAREIVARNGFADRIRVIAKPSRQLEIGSDLPEPADLLISEIFGPRLFDEGIVASLTDAHLRLLKPAAQILPPRAELRCALVNLERGGGALSIELVEGFDLSAFNIICPAIGRHIRPGAEGVGPRSVVRSALCMDFTAAPPFGPAQETIALQSLGGRIDAIAQWLRIDFDDGVVLENDPFAGALSHWQAQLFPLVEPLETRAGQPIEVEIRHLEGRLTARELS